MPERGGHVLAERGRSELDDALGSGFTGVRRARFDFDRTLDRLLTSRWLGFPLMGLILAGVFWLTIAGANVPSAMLAELHRRYQAEVELAVTKFTAALEPLLIVVLALGVGFVVFACLMPILEATRGIA